jgi:hypothetical protein
MAKVTYDIVATNEIVASISSLQAKDSANRTRTNRVRVRTSFIKENTQ